MFCICTVYYIYIYLVHCIYINKTNTNLTQLPAAPTNSNAGMTARVSLGTHGVMVFLTVWMLPMRVAVPTHSPVRL